MQILQVILPLFDKIVVLPGLLKVDLEGQAVVYVDFLQVLPIILCFNLRVSFLGAEMWLVIQAFACVELALQLRPILHLTKYELLVIGLYLVLVTALDIVKHVGCLLV